MTTDPDVLAAARAFVSDLIAKTQVHELDEPHGVIQTDPKTGTRQVYGPYPDAYEAATAAEAMHRYHEAKTGPPAMIFELVMHFDPPDPQEWTR